MEDGQGNQLVDQYSDDDFELLIVFVETENFNQSPNQEDCEALQATEKGTVVMDLDHALNATYDMQVNMGAALVNAEGKWESAPNLGEDSYMEATSALMSALGGGFPF